MGFVHRPAKGSHQRYHYPGVPGTHITISGKDGDDARPYQEAEVERAIARVNAARDAETGGGS
jgi:hypothetical protein